MTDEEAEPLWKAYFANRCRETRNALVNYYYGIIRLAAGPVVHRAPEWQPVTDLLGYGAIGLIQAVERFDPEQGVTFATFATRRIQGAIMDGQRIEDPLTRTARRKLNQCVGAFSEKDQPTHEDFQSAADESGMSVGEIQHLISFAHQGHYFDASGSDETHGEPSEGPWVAQSDETDVQVEVLAFVEHLSWRLAKLSEQERTFIYYHYGEDLGLRALESHLGVSDARLAKIRLNVVKQLTNRA